MKDPKRTSLEAEIVKQAMEWYLFEGHILKRAVIAVELSRACAALEAYEAER